MKPRTRVAEQGAVLILALLAMTVLMSLGAVLVMTTSTETAIAGNFRSRREAFYAAEAVAELAVAELRSANWAAVVDGAARSRFVDGAPDGVRALPSDAPVNLAAIANLANCGGPAPCAGPPRWHLFAHGPLRDFTAAADSPFYVLAFVQGAETESGVPVVVIRAEAFGPRGAHQAIELTLSRSPEGGTVVLRTVFG
jgi:hypothetical protein